MKKLLLFILFASIFIQVKADHITGGEFYYTYSSGPNNTINYNITYKLFMTCSSTRQFNDPSYLSVFDRLTNQRVADFNINLTNTEVISITNPDPCITNPPSVCYRVGYYNFTLTLPASQNGYLLTCQVNYRIDNIKNLETGYPKTGATYTAEIPGNTPEINAPFNNSAKFTGSDLVVVCASNSFVYNFGATDPDGDTLRYRFCNAYNSGSSGTLQSPPPPPPLYSVPYGNSFTGTEPLGPSVLIDPLTGIISGIAPDIGVYIVTVCVDEIRNGAVIATQRKDLQINIAPCNIAKAVLHPIYRLCKSSKSISISNLSSSPLITSTNWEILDRIGNVMFTTASTVLNYTFIDTGKYFIKLVINRNGNCSDSTTAPILVYPGFVPGFSFKGICINNPTTFTDSTISTYGIVNSWNWNFEGANNATQQNPIYTFNTIGNKNVSLIVTNTLGCIDTITKLVPIVNEPPIYLGFRDTLICTEDPTTLLATGSGTFSWLPNYNIINANTGLPTVTPSITTTYTVTMNDNGCISQALVNVRVTNQVDLTIMNDTIICRGDQIQLRTFSNAFGYNWTPQSAFINNKVPNPIVYPLDSITTYNLVANIGSCTATEKVVIYTVPYPTVNAGKDTTICFNGTAQLRGSSNVDSTSWDPGIWLSNTTNLNTTAKPKNTTTYYLYAYNKTGCPKPSIDDVTIEVLPEVKAYAGKDTAVIVGQTLQLLASGGSDYQWSPATGLSTTNFPNPTAKYTATSSGIKYSVIVRNNQCIDTAYMTVKVYNTAPTIFVASAFTPNADGKNDVLKPIAVGIKQIDFFRIYNRWGQVVYTTSVNGAGWDGRTNGVLQNTGTYVWMVKAIDYNGVPYFQKGTATLLQ